MNVETASEIIDAFDGKGGFIDCTMKINWKIIHTKCIYGGFYYGFY